MTRNIYAGDTLAAVYYSTGATTTPTYTHTDHLGGTNAVTNTNQETTEVSDYYPYGNQRIAQTYEGTTNKRGYIGEEYDAESGLNYLNARYYDNSRGQFTSQDPVFRDMGVDERTENLLRDPQLQNSYSYSRNNPVNLTDPNGECPVCVPFLIGAAVGGLSQYASDIIANREAGITGAAAYKPRSSWQEYNTSVVFGAAAAVAAVYTLPGAAVVSILGSGVGDVAGGRELDPTKAFTSGLVTIGTGGFFKWGVGNVSASNFIRSVTVGESFQGAVGAIVQSRYQATQNYNAMNGSSNYQSNLYVTPSGAVVSGAGELVSGPPKEE